MTGQQIPVGQQWTRQNEGDHILAGECLGALDADEWFFFGVCGDINWGSKVVDLGSYVTDRDVGDAPDEQMPLGTVGTGRAYCSAWGLLYMACCICEQYVIGEMGC